MYSFVSGILISVSMNAFTLIEFSVERPINSNSVIISTVISLFSAICWFWLSGETNRTTMYLRRQAKLNGTGLEHELDRLPLNRKRKILIVLTVAIFTSFV
jgi:hypothetical protein